MEAIAARVRVEGTASAVPKKGAARNVDTLQAVRAPAAGNRKSVWCDGRRPGVQPCRPFRRKNRCSGVLADFMMSAIDLAGDLGLVATCLLTLNILLGLSLSTRYHPREHWPHRNIPLFRLHNWAAWTGLGIGLLHPLPLLFAAHDRFRPLDIAFPLWSPVQPVENTLGAGALSLVILVVLTSYYRIPLGRRLWKTIHFSAYAAGALFLTHGLLTDAQLLHRPIDYLDGEKVLVEVCMLLVLAGGLLRIRYAVRRARMRGLTAAPLSRE